MIEFLLELLPGLPIFVFAFGQIRIDELFFELSVRGGPGAQTEVARFAGNMRNVGTSSGAAASELDRFSKTSERTSGGVQKLGALLKRLAGLFVGLFVIRSVVKAMVGFQQTMAEVATIAGGGAEQVEELRIGIQALTREVPQTAEELGAGAYQILSAGVKDTADIFEILNASARAAVAGLTDTETAVDAMTTILNAFGLQADQATRVADVLFQTVEDGKIRFEEVAATIGTAATSAALAGVELEELTAGMAVLTQRGLDAAVTTTALNRLFLTATTKSKEQSEAFQRLGVDFSVTAIQADGFQTVLQRVTEATGGNIEALAELFTEQRAARAAFILAGSGADQYTAALDRARNATGSAEEAFQIMNATALNQARILRNQVIVTFQEIGFAVLPGVASAMEFLSGVIREFIAGIKLLGAEAPLRIEQLNLAVERAGVAILDFVATSLSAFSDFLDGIAEQARTLAALPIPGAEVAGLIAAGFEGAAGAIDEAADSLDNLNEANRQQVAQLEQNIGFLREAVEQEQAAILAETEFVRTRRERAEATAAAAAAEEELQRLTVEQLERREKLLEDLAKRVSEVTKTAAEQARDEVQRLREAFVEEFGEISEEAEKQFQIVEQSIEEALSVEKAERLADEFAGALEQGLADIEFEAIGAAADPEARRATVLEQQRQLFERLLRQARARLATGKLTTAEEEALRRVIVEITKELERNAEGQERVAEEARRDADERLRALQSTIDLIERGVRGALDLAEAFGLVSGRTADIVENLLQAGTSAATLITSLGTGDIAGIISGGLGFLGGIVGGLFGPSPAELERRRILRENNRALERLRESVDDLTGTFDITGRDFTTALRAVTATLELEGLSREDLIEQIRRGGGALAFRALITSRRFLFATQEEQLEMLRRLALRYGDLNAILEMNGISVAELDAIAEELGITIRNEAGRIIPDALEDLQEALLAVEGQLVGFPETIEGFLRRFQLEIDAFDIEDPIEQFQLLQDLFREMATGTLPELQRRLEEATNPFERLAISMAILAERARLAGQQIPFITELLEIDVSTAEGRLRAEEIVEQLFRDLIAGVITPEELGVATFEEAIEILSTMEGLLDEIAEEQGDAGGELEGQTQDIRRSVQITELQASQLLAFQSTLVVRAEQRNVLLELILEAITGEAFEPPEPPPLPPGEPGPMILPPADVPPGGVPAAAAISIGAITIENISIGAGVTEEAATDAADVFVDRLSDRLGRLKLEQERTLGIEGRARPL